MTAPSALPRRLRWEREARGTRWDQRAACRGRDDIDWFPCAAHARSGSRLPRQLAAPAAVCATCPVIAACLTDILSISLCDRWGMRAGILWRGTDASPIDLLGILARRRPPQDAS